MIATGHPRTVGKLTYGPMQATLVRLSEGMKVRMRSSSGHPVTGWCLAVATPPGPGHGVDEKKARRAIRLSDLMNVRCETSSVQGDVSGVSSGQVELRAQMLCVVNWVW